MICPSCGQENPEGFRLCGMCGAALAEPAARAEERKVVSVLFVDLVGSTAAAEAADPEDVRARLDRYHTHVKQEIERFGGTVEKFIGDAVMAVFGAPVAHEDDAERAVRAGLRVVEELGEHVRAAVNTGEALVSVGARPEAGEALVAGDVVNTAARLQGAAVPGALVVGEQTERATRQAIDYEELAPVELKGKPEPVALWRALAARSRFGVDVEQPAAAPLIGREHELRLLEDVYARTLREHSLQLVTLVGEPGAGKSRLVSEFRQWVDDRPELVYWRQGRCLSYGEGVAFWALGEVVKAQAGILESEGPEEAAAKLEHAIEAVPTEESERDWLRARLAPLVGVLGDDTAERDESFTAWLRFLEAIAAARPLVLVLEDLHWADEAMLDFVDYLAEWSSGVPVLAVCTARPELYERRPGWGGGKRNATTISLSPLSDEDTARLIAALTDRSVLPAETQAALLDRAGGNPLYAEQFARMLADRGLLEGAEEGIAVPETVQAVIAARLDTLPPERKALLQDAAVVGKVFWTGALATMGGRGEPDVVEGLHQLVRKELVRSARRSSVEGESEYSFWHLLVRDVAYSQIPRAARAAKHRAAAEWIERIASERVADHADLLAHHYGEALALARAAGRDEEAAELAAPAARSLELAGDRAMQLDVGQAEAYYVGALELLPPGHVDRPRVLVKRGRCAESVSSLDDAVAALEEAVAGFEELGDVHGRGTATGFLSMAMWSRGDTARAYELLLESRELLERGPPSPELARAYGRTSFQEAMRGRSQEALDWAEQAVELAEGLRDDGEICFALQMRGTARGVLGDRGCLDDLRAAVSLGVEGGPGTRTTVTAYNNLGFWLWLNEGPAPAFEVQQAGIAHAKRRGHSPLWNTAETTWTLFDLGRWDELLRVAEEVLAAERERGRPTQVSAIVSPLQAAVLVRRGRAAEAAALVHEFLPAAREIGDAQVLGPAVHVAALVAQAQGDPAAAADLLADPGRRFWSPPDGCRVLLAAGERERAGALLELPLLPTTRGEHGQATVRALLAEADGELARAADLYGDAAQRWQSYGHVLERALALLGRGRCLVALARDGSAELGESRLILQGLGAAPLLVEIDALLGGVSAAEG